MKNSTNLHFGSLIKDLVDRSGENKNEAAKRLGYSKNNMYEIFRKEDVGTDVLKKVAEAYRVDIGHFFAGNIYQSGKINAVGEPAIHYKTRSEENYLKVLQAENDGLKAANKALREQIETQREQVETLKEMVLLLKERLQK